MAEKLESVAIIRAGATHSRGFKSHAQLRNALGDEDAWDHKRRPTDTEPIMAIEPRNPFETADDGVTDLQEKVGGFLEDQTNLNQVTIDEITYLVAHDEAQAEKLANSKPPHPSLEEWKVGLHRAMIQHHKDAAARLERKLAANGYGS